MARVTVEDCVTKIPNRFQLVMLASQRARNISAGAELLVERDNDKNPVVALREIAEQSVDLDELQESLIRGLQKFVEMDEPEEDEVDLIAIQQALDSEGGEIAPEAGAMPEKLRDDQAAPEAGAVSEKLRDDQAAPEAGAMPEKLGDDQAAPEAGAMSGKFEDDEAAVMDLGDDGKDQESGKKGA